MLDSHQKSTGTEFTRTAALLVVALIFIPAVVMLSRPVGYDSLVLAVAASISCVVFAWRNWKRHSELSIPSLETLKVRPK